MQRHNLEHEINCPPERMWELFFDDDFNKQMYEVGMGFPKFEVAEKRDDGKVLYRRLVMVPKLDVPGALKKVMGDRTGFEESGEWVRSANEWRWKIVLAAFGDKVKITGTMRLEPKGEDHCRRITKFEVEAKIFGIGKLVEKTSADNVRSGWDDSARWINQYLAKNP